MLTVPAHFAEGHGDGNKGPASRAKAPVAQAKATPPDPSGTLPDPEPLSLREQWQYELLYDHGKVTVKKVALLRFSRPRVSARNMGRYAIELWIGRELIDRIRFDFPMLAGEPAEVQDTSNRAQSPQLLESAVVSQTVLVPASPRARRARLIDRASGQTTELAWPPEGPSAGSTRARDCSSSEC
jgi:hypothetical protein